MLIRKLFPLIIWTACAFCFLLMPESAAEGAKVGLKICATAILPSLFPFFVLTNYWISAGYADSLSFLAAPFIEQLFHIPGSAASALILGSIGGYPIGAKTAASLYRSGLLSKNEAEQVTFFCNNAGPAFVLNIIGTAIFQSIKIGIILYAIHILSAYLMGILFRPKEHIKSAAFSKKDAIPPPFSQLWTSSITDAGRTAVLVCSFILFFSILTQCLQNVLPFGGITLGILELAGGAKLLASSQFPQPLKFIISSFLLGFGGLCVMLQSLAVLTEEGLSGKKLLLGKICQGFLSAILAAGITPLLPLPHPCGISKFQLPSPLFQSMILLPIIFLGFRFLKESSGKVKNNQV